MTISISNDRSLSTLFGELLKFDEIEREHEGLDRQARKTVVKIEGFGCR